MTVTICDRCTGPTAKKPIKADHYDLAQGGSTVKMMMPHLLIDQDGNVRPVPFTCFRYSTICLDCLLSLANWMEAGRPRADVLEGR